jgi:hypothetical protein
LLLPDWDKGVFYAQRNGDGGGGGGNGSGVPTSAGVRSPARIASRRAD